ncbi:MAG: hypothetical protein J5495_00975 [Bacteroidales bacterium]|nr:hypothetical protein [Bacteroidales bacterium]
MKDCPEWENGFDLLYQNITSNQAPGLEPYEKSVFLTEAEYTVFVGLYNGTFRNSFEETEEWTSYLSTHVCQEDCALVANAPKLMDKSKVYELPEDLLFITLEMCSVNVEGCGTRQAVVVPVTQDEFWRTHRNPFKRQNADRVLRLAYGSSDVLENGLSTSRYSELVSDNDIVKYTVRYLRKPDPIIVQDLPDGLTIDGESKAMTCKLPESLHQAILEEAVRRAKAVWIS